MENGSKSLGTDAIQHAPCITLPDLCRQELLLRSKSLTWVGEKIVFVSASPEVPPCSFLPFPSGFIRVPSLPVFPYPLVDSFKNTEKFAM